MKKLTFTALALMMCSAAWGAAIPQASRYDSRVQQVIYNPQNVTVVNTKPGFMTTLVFAGTPAADSAKIGIAAGSFISAVVGLLILKYAPAAS